MQSNEARSRSRRGVPGIARHTEVAQRHKLPRHRLRKGGELSCAPFARQALRESWKPFRRVARPESIPYLHPHPSPSPPPIRLRSLLSPSPSSHHGSHDATSVPELPAGHSALSSCDFHSSRHRYVAISALTAPAPSQRPPFTIPTKPPRKYVATPSQTLQ